MSIIVSSVRGECAYRVHANATVDYAAYTQYAREMPKQQSKALRATKQQADYLISAVRTLQLLLLLPKGLKSHAPHGRWAEIGARPLKQQCVARGSTQFSIFALPKELGHLESTL